MKKLLLIIFFSCSFYAAFASVSSVTQKGWRWRNDDGSEASATWAADKNQLMVLTSKDENIRLRLEFQVDYTAQCCNNHYSVNSRISYSVSPDGPFIKIPTNASSGEHFVLSTSGFVTNNSTTTRQISDNTLSYADGEIVDKNDTDMGSITFVGSDGGSRSAEYEWVIKPTSNISDNTYYFKLEGLHAYSTLASLSFSMVTDVVKPSVTISSDKSNPTNANPIPVFINFSEKVKNFTAGDLQIGNGSVASLTESKFAHIGTIGHGDNQLAYPWGMALDVDGKIYVADYSGHRVQIFNSDRTYAATIGTGTAGSGNNEFNYPSDVLVDDAGKIYVVDPENHRIQVFNSDYSYSATIGTGVRGNANNQFNSPYGIALDASGKFYVADRGNHRVQIFNADYSYAATIGTGIPGNGNGQFNNPYGISVGADGKIYVVEYSNNRVQVFNADRSYAATIGTGAAGSGNNELRGPMGVTVDAFGKIYVADHENHRIQLFNADYSYAATLGTGIAGASNNQFNYPTSIAISPDGSFYIVDNNNQRIQLFNEWTYKAFITPAADGLVTVDIPEGSLTDEAGNENTAAKQFSITYDGTAPSLAISSSEGSATSETSFPVTFTFTEKVFEFTKDHVEVGNGSITDWQTSDNIIFTAEIMRSENGVVTVDVAAGVIKDAAGNANSAATQFSIDFIDIVKPTAEISSNEPDPTNKTAIPVTIQFDEVINGFTKEDLVVGNGTVISLGTPGVSYLSQIGTGTAGAGTNQLNKPRRVYVDAAGMIYVADASNHRVQIFNADHTNYKTIGTGTAGTGNTQLNHPMGVTVGQDGKIYVADYLNHRVQVFDKEGTYTATIGSGVQGSGNNQFSSPVNVAIDASGKVYVADYANRRVQIMNADGTYVATLGTGASGSGNYDFTGPLDVKVDASGRIYVADVSNHRIQIFNADRTYAATIGTGVLGSTNTQFNYPSGVSVDNDGKIYVADRQNHRIQIFNADLSYSTTLGTGVSGAASDQLNTPYGVDINIDGTIYIADVNNDRIQVYNNFDFYVALITPATDGLVTVDLPVGAVTDEAGNENTAAEQFSITYDGTAPEISISSSEGSSTAKSSFLITFTFTEEIVTGFSKDDVVIVNGSISDLQSSDNITFTAEITPVAYGAVTLNVAAGVIKDKAGNDNITATEFSINYIDTVKPTVAISSDEADPTNNSPILVNIDFDEPVKGFTAKDLVISNGTVASLTGAEISYSETIGKTGNPGTANDQLNSPFGMAAGKNGKIYVADQFNHRVQVFNEDRTYAATMGTGFGSGNGQLNRPFAVAADTEGKVFVIEYGNHRLQIFNADGEYVAKIGGIQGTEDYEFSGPTSVALDAEGNIYVADQGNHRVQIYTADLVYVSTIGTTGIAGNNNQLLASPFGVAIDAKGNIIISDQGNHRIQLFNADREHIATIGTGTAGNDDNQLNNPLGLAVDAEGKIYVAEISNHRIKIFDASYKFAATIGTTGNSGSGNDQFNFITGVAVDADNSIYAVDQNNHRIQVFENGGAAYIAAVIPAQDGLVTVGLPAGAVTDESGNENTAAETFSIYFDGTAPVLSISSEEEHSTNKESFVVSFTFTEKVDGFTSENVTVKNGTIKNLETDDYITYNAVLTPDAEGMVTLYAAAGSAMDAAGNQNKEAAQFSILYDVTAPAVTIASEENDLTNKRTFEISFTFSEVVKGFSLEDIIVENGSASNIESTDQVTYIAEITATEGGMVTVNVAENIATDVARNGNTAAKQFSIKYDLPPVITAGQVFSILKNSAAGTSVNTVAATDIISETEFQDWTIVSGNTGNAFAINAETGEVTVSAKEKLDGSILSFTLSITVSDGLHTSLAENVVINLISVNDAPVFVRGDDIIVLEDAGLQIVANWATGIHAGGPDESSQVLVFHVAMDNPALFVVAPVISADGTLSFTTVENDNGIATISVSLSDNGGTENGGQDRSDVQTFTITVIPVNDVPVLVTAIADQIGYIGQIFNFTIPAGSFKDVDEGDELVFAASLGNGNPLPHWLNFDAETRTFSGSPSLGDQGQLTIKVTATDQSHAFVSDTFTLEINDQNHVPSDIILSSMQVEENQPAGTLVGIFTTIDSDQDDVHVYQLVDGSGSENNGAFYIEGNKLFSATAFDFEEKSSYSIRVQSNDNKSGAYEKSFIVSIIDVGDARVFIPNLFSPNGDGSNDVFRVRANGIQQISFRVFNRWGEMVYETTNVLQATEIGWDGTFKGKNQPSGSYVWQITGKFTDGTPISFGGKNTGNITLIH